MPRSGKIDQRQIQSDHIYNSQIVAKLINKVMVSGKKTIAEKIVYEALKKIKDDGKDPVLTLEKAIENITPRMEVKPRRVGGASYMIPLEVRGSRKLSLAIRWLVNSSRSKTPADVEKIKNKPLMINKLASEILAAAEGEGKAVNKKDESHRMAEANKAFAHFRW